VEKLLHFIIIKCNLFWKKEKKTKKIYLVATKKNWSSSSTIVSEREKEGRKIKFINK
jgi:hypothetical protein